MMNILQRTGDQWNPGAPEEGVKIGGNDSQKVHLTIVLPVMCVGTILITWFCIIIHCTTDGHEQAEAGSIEVAVCIQDDLDSVQYYTVKYIIISPVHYNQVADWRAAMARS